MIYTFTLSQFLSRFPDDKACLEEIKKLRYPNGMFCLRCKKITMHYKISERTAYSCKRCRNHTYPLADTVFAKTTTPLRTWFFCMFLMTHTRSTISAKQLQQELSVTYKTAWRMRSAILTLMKQNNGDLLKGTDESIHKWLFFNKIEFTVTQKETAERRA